MFYKQFAIFVPSQKKNQKVTLEIDSDEKSTHEIAETFEK